MNCPLCDRKIPTARYEYGLNWTCSSIEEAAGGYEWNHYVKSYVTDVGVPYYAESAYLLPFRVDNFYYNDNGLNPHCNIYKRVMRITDYGHRWNWEHVVRLNKPLEILKYKKMRARIQTIIVML